MLLHVSVTHSMLRERHRKIAAIDLHFCLSDVGAKKEEKNGQSTDVVVRAGKYKFVRFDKIQIALYPTCPFTIRGSTNFFVVQERRATDLRLTKLGKGRSGF